MTEWLENSLEQIRQHLHLLHMHFFSWRQSSLKVCTKGIVRSSPLIKRMIRIRVASTSSQHLRQLPSILGKPFAKLTIGRMAIFIGPESDHCTMAKFQWEVRHSEFWTLPLILSASKYFRLISLSLYPHPNISDKFLCHFIFVEDKMNNRPYPTYMYLLGDEMNSCQTFSVIYFTIEACCIF